MQSFIPNKVNVTLSVSEDQVKNNIQKNLNQIPSWLETTFYPNGFEAYILSAGPSLEKYVQELNLVERAKNPNRSFLTFCVKHALPRLVKMGLNPDFCVILDGRDLEGVSTHGVQRKELFEYIPEKTVFLIASMASPSYANYLSVNGGRILGWHTDVVGLKTFVDAGQILGPVVNGGTSSGTRTLGIAHALGIRKVSLVGFDSCVLNPSEDDLRQLDNKGRIKYQPVDLPVLNPTATPDDQKKIDEVEKSFLNQGFVYVAALSKRFFTTGELLAQAHDFEKLLQMTTLDMDIQVFDDGIVSHIYNNMPIHRREYSFIDYISKKCPKISRDRIETKHVKLL
jgi:hypothetical protein